jgi:glycosyltransferase involved in cell wall biosynthesis
MRVVHVSPTDVEGGAPRGAYNLHKALCAAGAESLMLVQRKYSDDPTVLTPGGAPRTIYDALRDRLDRVPLRLYDWQSHNWWTVGWLPFDVSGAIHRLKPDVVQFHWVGRGAVPFKTLARVSRYPIVWTLRDMWPLTGGCHYSGGCDKFATGCGACPQLGSRREFDLSRWQWRRKHRAWKGVAITYVALSRWMAACARRSPLTHGNEVTIIPNGVDVERYAPVDKAAARAAWHLPRDKRIVLFGANNSTTDPRKGFAYLSQALQILAARGWAERALAVVFGARAGAPRVGLDVRYMGYLRDDVSLALLYAGADVMVVPSTEENFGKTAIEAMACGVPVTVFANTGQFDIVDHKVNGYLAENLSAPDLAQGIAWCLEEGAKGDGLGRRAREKAVRCFDIRTIAGRHLSLYHRLLEERCRVADAMAGEAGASGLSRAVSALSFGVDEAAVPPRSRSVR